MTRYEIRKLQRSPAALPLWEQDLLADATEVECPILPCTNYCNKGTLTYLLQAMAVKG
jgi:hypothetical protein